MDRTHLDTPPLVPPLLPGRDLAERPGAKIATTISLTFRAKLVAQVRARHRGATTKATTPMPTCKRRGGTRKRSYMLS
jgi:hypothetical protein